MTLILNIDRLRWLDPVLAEEMKKVQDYINANVVEAAGSKVQPPPASVAQTPPSTPSVTTTAKPKQAPPPPTVTSDPSGAGGFAGRALK